MHTLREMQCDPVQGRGSDFQRLKGKFFIFCANPDMVHCRRNLFWDPKCHKGNEKCEKWIPARLLGIFMFLVLKSIGVGTLFSQLWKLNNFCKKSSNFIENY